MGTVENKQGSSKYVLFPQNARKSISTVSILLIEIVQSISSFPNDTDSIIQEIIQFIIQTFTTSTKNNTIIGKIFEKFIDDLCSLLSHPFYPVSKVILKSIIEALFPSVSKKDENTRISIKTNMRSTKKYTEMFTKGQRKCCNYISKISFRISFWLNRRNC